MNKADFFLTDGLLIQNDKYILRVLNEEDRENYLKLYQENPIVASAFSKMSDVDYDEFAEFMWEKIPEEDSLYVSVFLKEDYTYVGNIVVQHMSLTTPEIGIDVLEEYHRQGIAYETIPLFAKRVQELMPVDYFVVRIYSDNEPSKKLFEKLGAEVMGKEPSEFAEALSHLKEKSKEEYEEFTIRNPDAEKIADERCILQFKYFPG